MKAVILAAGKGERLKGTVDDIPKPMIIYRGKPILQHNIELCERFGVREFFINTHHLPMVIRSFFGDGSAFGVKIQYSFEPEQLGTAGALNNFRDGLNGESFYVLYGDNFSEYDLGLLKSTFENRKLASRGECIGVIAFHYREDVLQSGVGELDEEGRIIRFIEKPAEGTTMSRWVNAGIYYLSPKILDRIPKGFSDFGKDIFPRLIEDGVPLYGVCSKTPVKAFDTPELMRSSLGVTDEPKR